MRIIAGTRTISLSESKFKGMEYGKAKDLISQITGITNEAHLDDILKDLGTLKTEAVDLPKQETTKPMRAKK